jgi:membrane protein implicated in regulation of membrane protease activity
MLKFPSWWNEPINNGTLICVMIGGIIGQIMGMLFDFKVSLVIVIALAITLIVVWKRYV